MKPNQNVLGLHRLLSRARLPVTLAQIQETLKQSRRTVLRTIKDMREQLDAPIEHSREEPKGYRYTDKAYELPGVFFSLDEMQALLLLLTLLESFHPGLLEAAFAPLKKKLGAFLRKMGVTADTHGRIRLLRVAARPVGAAFETVAAALLQRKKLDMQYVSRDTGKVSQREVSPQRLTLYRDNWYLDAWCHVQNALRTFSLDCIEPAKLVEERAVDISTPKLDRHLGAGYGIYSGAPTAVAKLRFTPRRAIWVAPEIWHPDQKGHYEESGHYVRELPYSESKELILDIMRFGPEVEVLAPLDLRQAVAQRHREAAAIYA